MRLLDLLNQDGAALKKVAGTYGGEYAGPCPSCGGTDRFRVWPERGRSGRYWCRGCNKNGNDIQYLKEFRGLSYIQACHLLGRNPGPLKGSLNWKWRSRPHGFESWKPKKPTSPGDQWAQMAGQFVEWAKQQLWNTNEGKEARAWLHERGLSEDSVKAFRLGWNTWDWWPMRETWGLPAVLKDNGKPKKLWLPLGLVIPKFANDRVVRIRVRRPEGDPRYYFLPGSDTGPLIIHGGPTCVVVESELDAILLHQDAGDLVTSIALGSAQNKPDESANGILERAEMILVSLDADDAGSKAAWTWWLQHYPRARRWPTIQGKDPSEARQNGLDLRAWVMAGLLPDRETEANWGAPGTLPPSKNENNEGDKEEIMGIVSKQKRQESLDEREHNAAPGFHDEGSLRNPQTKRKATMTPLQAIRKHCLWCCCDQAIQVRLCPAVNCPVNPYRLGPSKALRSHRRSKPFAADVWTAPDSRGRTLSFASPNAAFTLFVSVKTSTSPQ